MNVRIILLVVEVIVLCLLLAMLREVILVSVECGRLLLLSANEGNRGDFTPYW